VTDTLQGVKRIFHPADSSRVRLYLCGPTVYATAHIGNFRPAVAFDVLFRLLRHTYGAESVVYARNFTDIDDKIITAAQAEGVGIEVITDRYTARYLADSDTLGVLRPTYAPTATGHVGDMIALIADLIEKGHAYATLNGVNFHVPSMPTYGRLSGRSQEELRTGARVDPDPTKRDPADFALWKAAKPGEPAWDSPWGPGRPGWHIECSAMIEALLGSPIDIHMGGQDLIFPHHENEIAQTECAHGRPLANYWLHNGFLSVDSEKMSKSLGNVVTVHALSEHWAGEVIRLGLMSAHYRAPLDWTEELLTQCRATLDRLYNALRRVNAVALTPNVVAEGVVAALSDDLNTPEALAELSRLATLLNKAEEPDEQAALKAELLHGAGLVGLLGTDPDVWARGDAGEAARIDGLIADRIAARKARNFAEADRIRDALAAEGIEIMDGPQGSTWRRKG
jgi:cysteinyl-tRNA synthetase